MKTGWRDATLALRNLAVSNIHTLRHASFNSWRDWSRI